MAGNLGMVERMAQALHNRSRLKGGTMTQFAWNDPMYAAVQRALIEIARDILTAMREPTDAMVMEGRNTTDDLTQLGTLRVWQEMIDTALAE